MSETTPETVVVETPDSAPVAESKTFTEDYVKELRAEAAKYRTEAKQAKAEIDKVRKSSLTEAEQAVLEAETRGRQSVLVEFGQRLARTEFVAAAARRNPGYDAAAVLDDLNLSRYIGDDGEPDSKAIAAAVDRLVPEATANPRPVGDADLGARTAPLPLNGDGIEDALRKKLGIA